MSEPTFRDLEHAGWQDKADAYDDHFAVVTDQAIGPILDTFKPVSGKRLLDVACGTGHLVNKAALTGAVSEGVDFASTMVSRAKANFPDLTFIEGDAQALPFGDGCFDAVTLSFGILHLEVPEKAVSEAWRVLRTGGRYTLTAWCSPDQGGEFFDLVMGSVQAHGSFDVPLPPAPAVFRFADPDEITKVLTDAGFTDIKLNKLPLTWEASEPQQILQLIYKSVVRLPMILNAQPTETRESIHQAILDGSERYRNGDTFRFAFPAWMATARKV